MAEYPEDGTIHEVLDWVGDDVGRAREALEAEEDGQGRVTLLRQLEELASAGSVRPTGSLSVAQGPDQDEDDPDLASANIANRNS